MRCWVRKVKLSELTIAQAEASVLIPASIHDEEEFEKLRKDVAIRADLVVPRNAGLHRKAFALLKIVFPHTNYPTIDRLRAAMTIGAGFVEDVVDPYDGSVSWIPKSWAFEAMDDIEFTDLYNRLIDVALHIVPDSKREDWEEAVDQIVRM